MKVASFKYSVSRNLGDNIQTLAVERFFPKVDKKFDRDSLSLEKERDQYLMVMNGWFSRFSENWPPSECITPIFIGFHMATNNATIRQYTSEKGIRYLKSHEPIGCRDRATANTLSQHGVRTFYSKCLTLTFPKREKPVKNGKVAIVDANHIWIPKKLRKKDVVLLTQRTNDIFSDETNVALAKKLLDFYREEVELIVTTRLHCALPCIAMGIPVLFFGDSQNTRTSILKDLGVPIHSEKLFRKLKNKTLMKIKRFLLKKFVKVNWNPESIDVDDEKNKLIQTVEGRINEYADRLQGG